jgi:hypothetical protein
MDISKARRLMASGVVVVAVKDDTTKEFTGKIVHIVEPKEWAPPPYTPAFKMKVEDENGKRRFFWGHEVKIKR